MKTQQITSASHPLIKHLVKLRQDKRTRQEHHSVLIQGKKMIHELPKEWEVKAILATEEKLFPEERSIETKYLIPESLLQKICAQTSPEGVVAEVVMPEINKADPKKRLLILENVSDPGNLGTLFRTALAFGWEAVFLLGNCCDPFNDKALRSSMGAVFRLPICIGGWKELEEILKTNHFELLVADLAGKEASRVSGEQIALLLGSESNGVSDEARKRGVQVALPMADSVESLNVSIAGGILLHLYK